MKYITIDGDDIGSKIASSYLMNDVGALKRVNDLVQRTTKLIADFLREQGFVVIFCAADGVAGYCDNKVVDNNFIYNKIKEIAGSELSFSAGVGKDLRESYIALLFAKSTGKARLNTFEDIDENV